MRFAYDPEASEVEKELAKVEALQSIASQLERIAGSVEDDDRLVTDGGTCRDGTDRFGVVR